MVALKYRFANPRRARFIHPRFIIAARPCCYCQPEVLSMTTISSRAIATAFASMLLMSSAFAQTTTPATPAPAATPAPKMAPAEKAEKKAEKPARTAASLDCSKEADAKGLKGKERKKFRAECKKAGAEKAK
jgi:hypothetical protein